MFLTDGKFVKVDAADNSNVLTSLNAANRQMPNVSVNISVNGRIDGDTIKIDSVNCTQ